MLYISSWNNKYHTVIPRRGEVVFFWRCESLHTHININNFVFRLLFQGEMICNRDVNLRSSN